MLHGLHWAPSNPWRNRIIHVSFHLCTSWLVLHFLGCQVWGRYVKKLEDFAKPENIDVAVQCLNELITNTLHHIPDVITYLSRLRNQSVFNFCAIPQVWNVAFGLGRTVSASFCRVQGCGLLGKWLWCGFLCSGVASELQHGPCITFRSKVNFFFSQNLTLFPSSILN